MSGEHALECECEDSGHEMNSREYIPYCPIGPYSWVIIEYDVHYGFACDWEDRLEEMIFIIS